MNSLNTTPEAPVNGLISALKHSDLTENVEVGDKFSDGVFMSQDPQHQREMSCTSPEGRVLRLRAKAAPGSQWTALHIQPVPEDLSGISVLGVVIKSQSFGNARTSRVCLRSGFKDSFVDTFFPKHLVSFSEPGAHLDLLQPDMIDELPALADWRELIIFFPMNWTDIVISDIRVFMV